MRRSGLIVLAVGACVAGLGGMSGCSSVPRADYDAAVAESVQLRADLASTRERLAAETTARQAAEDRAAQAEGALSSLPTTDTGFEGIEGTTISNRGRDVVVGVAGDVLFDSGKTELKRAAKATLDRIAGVINSQYGGRAIRVEGYTDTDPIRKSQWETNERLSAERALAVEGYLVAVGIDNDRIYSAAFGPSHQKGSKSASRRVEIVIIE